MAPNLSLQFPLLIPDFFIYFLDTESRSVPCPKIAVFPLSFFYPLPRELLVPVSSSAQHYPFQEVLFYPATSSCVQLASTVLPISRYTDVFTSPGNIPVQGEPNHSLSPCVAKEKSHSEAAECLHKLLLTCLQGPALPRNVCSCFCRSRLPTVCHDSSNHSPLSSDFFPCPKSL